MSKWFMVAFCSILMVGIGGPVFTNPAQAGGFVGSSVFVGHGFTRFPSHSFVVNNFCCFPRRSFVINNFCCFYPRTRVFLGFNEVVPLYPSYVYPAPPAYYYPPVYAPPATAADGQIQIEVNLPDAEIWVDGRYIGLVRHFAGPAMVGVAPGTHVVEFRISGKMTSTQVIVNSGAVSVVKVELSEPTSRY